MKLYKGDCLIESDKIESGSVDLILTDLPYGTMKGRDYSKQPNQKEGSKTAQDHQWDSVIDTEKIMQIANRILRKNGKMVLFAQDPFSTELKNKAIPNLPYNYSCVWEKSNFANCLLINKACANFYEDILIFSKNNKKYDRKNNNPLRDYFDDILTKYGKDLLIELFIKEGRYSTEQSAKANVSLKFGQNKTNFEFMAQTLYSYLVFCGIEFDKSYEELKEIHNNYHTELKRELNEKYPSTFNLWEGNKYKSNILKYDRSEVGHHPTQKPVLLLEDLIKTFSNENDLVVDLTMGSGSTGVACKKTKRDFIGIEMNDEYFKIAEQRINEIKYELF